jgi:NAD(P)H dehydrogenase (quinone)
MGLMNVLVVYAHPEPQSFNGAMKEAAVAALTRAGHQVRVSDLYAMKFNPVVDPAQFPERADPAFFKLQKEQRHAAETGTVAADVAAEHEKLSWADLVIFQFPLWWGSMPAILKGWVDRVFSMGQVYGRGAKGLEGRKALLSVTASDYGEPAEGARHLSAELTHVTGNMFALAKLEVLEPFFVFGPGTMSDEERAACLERYGSHVLAIAGEG